MKKNRKKPSKELYLAALEKADKALYADASDITGLEQEIALLRIKLRQLLEKEPENFELCLKAASTIARLASVHYKINSSARKSLREAITRVITEIAVPLGIKTLFK